MKGRWINLIVFCCFNRFQGVSRPARMKLTMYGKGVAAALDVAIEERAAVPAAAVPVVASESSFSTSGVLLSLEQHGGSLPRYDHLADLKQREVSTER